MSTATKTRTFPGFRQAYSYVYLYKSVRKFTRCTPTLSYVKLLHDTRVRVKHHLYEERETTNNELTSTFSRLCRMLKEIVLNYRK